MPSVLTDLSSITTQPPPTTTVSYNSCPEYYGYFVVIAKHSKPLSLDELIGTTNLTSNKQCGRLCLTVVQCKSFTFNKVSLLCSLYSSVFYSNIESAAQTHYYKRRDICWLTPHPHALAGWSSTLYVLLDWNFLSRTEVRNTNQNCIWVCVDVFQRKTFETVRTMNDSFPNTNSWWHTEQSNADVNYDCDDLDHQYNRAQLFKANDVVS